MSNKNLESMKKRGRYILPAEQNDDELGPLQLLPGQWKAEGTGWNMIALPFADGKFNYRVLMNQYDEELNFTLVDKGVPNRGLARNGDQTSVTDQFVVTLDYLQKIKQIKAEDSPVSGDAGDPDLAIHHEPGLWLHMLNEETNGIDIARLATIPHGDSALALGTAKTATGKPDIPVLNGLPIGVSQDLDANPYLEPYKHFVDKPFFGTVPESVPGFPGFNPIDLNAILNFANQSPETDGAEITVLHVDSDVEDAGIKNIPFVVKQANATTMTSTFWIQKIKDPAGGEPRLRMQYSQVVMLDFFPRQDGQPGLIRWPHVSICTLNKVSDIVPT